MVISLGQDDVLLTVREVADLLHLHTNTVKRAGDRGALPFLRVNERGDRRYRLEDVRQFVAMATSRVVPVPIRMDLVLSAKEVADLLHLHVMSVKRLCDWGELACYRVNERGDRRFRLEDVLDFVTSGPDWSRVRLDPHLRGHVSPRTLATLRAFGFRAVRVGRAAYLTYGVLRWILGVWGKDDRPDWADRLDQHHRWLIGRGDPTPLEARREAAWLPGAP